jgi:uncharacterized membrane protein
MQTIIYGAILAILDVFTLSFAKKAFTSRNLLFLLGAMIVSAFQLGIFYKAMAFTSITVLNLSWDLISDIFVTLFGLFVLKEQVSSQQLLGVISAFVSIFLMSA